MHSLNFKHTNWFAMIMMAMAISISPSLAAQEIGADSVVSLVNVIKDPRLDALTKKQSQINKTSSYKNSAGNYKGYRIMVMNTNDRDLAYKTRSEILKYFPDKGVYMGYQAPYFKLKAGDFVKKEDAEKFKKELGRYIKQSLFVINDIIKISPEDEARLLLEEQDQKKF